MTSLLHALPSPRGTDADSADLPAALLALADADADALADALHDGVLQSLVVARYAADAAVRGGDPALVRDAVQEALVALRCAVWQVRPRGDRGLLAALTDLAAHRTSTGAVPVLLDVDDDAAAAVPPAAAAAAYRLVQRALAPAARPVTVRVRREAADPGAVVLELDAAVPDLPAEALRALAVGATVTSFPGGTRLRMLPLDPITEGTP